MPAVDEGVLLTQTGVTTPLGRLLRCFWLPIAIAAELTEEHPIRPVRILSEDLVLFRDTDGRAGLIQTRCPHGGYPLELGSADAKGIVCARHGWHFDGEGNCFVVNLTGTIYPMAWAHARTYPVQEHAGLLWAYLGPPPTPPLSDVPVLADGLRLEAQTVVDLPWLDVLAALPARTGPRLRLHLPVDDAHTMQMVFLRHAAGELDLPPFDVESLCAALLRAIARIEAGEDLLNVARDFDSPFAS